MPRLPTRILDAKSELLKFLRSSDEGLSLASQFSLELLSVGKGGELMTKARMTLSGRAEL